MRVIQAQSAGFCYGVERAVRMSDEAYLQQAGKAAGNYVNHNAGALEKIMKDITL